MANANVTSGVNRLKHAHRTLKERWEEIGPTWTDAVRRDFEERHILPLESAIDAAINGMRDLGEVLDKIRRECSEPGDAFF